MVRRGSTVRVRQRALQNRRKSALCRSGRLAPRRMWGGYGAVYGAFAYAGPVCGGKRARTRRAMVAAVDRRRRDEGGLVQPVLAPLAVGDDLPWKLGRDGQPQWLL